MMQVKYLIESNNEDRSNPLVVVDQTGQEGKLRALDRITYGERANHTEGMRRNPLYRHYGAKRVGDLGQ